MVENLKELNKICQKPNYKTVGNWMVRHILRDAALPCTWLLLHTPITANQVTFFALLVGLFGNLLLSATSDIAFLSGTLLLQLWYYLDHVDGQIARYRGTSGLTGRFFDFLMHHLIHGTLPFALSGYCYVMTANSVFLIWGFGASISMVTFNMIHDIKSKTFIEKILGLPVLKPKQKTEETGLKTVIDQSAPRLVFSMLHKLCEMHVMMNLLTGLALCSIIFPSSFDFRFLAFISYGILIPAITILKIAYIILTKQLERDFNSAFE